MLDGGEGNSRAPVSQPAEALSVPDHAGSGILGPSLAAKNVSQFAVLPRAPLKPSHSAGERMLVGWVKLPI